MSAPTILIPGIKGTKLVDTNTLDFDTIWSGIQSKYETIDDLELLVDPKFERSNKSIIERSDVEDLAYKEIVYYLRKKTEADKKGNIYIFGYDWRQSNRENGRRLKEYVEYLKKKITAEKFNFVTHSMGGMIFSCYLKELNNDYKEINKAAITVCPFQGSINAFIALIVGEGGINFPLFNSNDDFRKIARTFPSVYELCPVYQGAVTFLNSPGDFNLFDHTHWQSNIIDEMVEERISLLKKFRIDNPAMANLSALPPEVRERIVIIAGSGEKTKNRVVIEPQTPDGTAVNFFNFMQPDGDGDGTVPLESATIYKDAILTLRVESRWYNGATHGFFLNDGRVQAVINRFLSDDTAHKDWWSDIAGTVSKVE